MLYSARIEGGYPYGDIAVPVQEASAQAEEETIYMNKLILLVVTM